jgi:hypothetical protein
MSGSPIPHRSVAAGGRDAGFPDIGLFRGRIGYIPVAFPLPDTLVPLYTNCARQTQENDPVIMCRAAV